MKYVTERAKEISGMNSLWKLFEPLFWEYEPVVGDNGTSCNDIDTVNKYLGKLTKYVDEDGIHYLTESKQWFYDFLKKNGYVKTIEEDELRNYKTDLEEDAAGLLYNLEHVKIDKNQDEITKGAAAAHEAGHAIYKNNKDEGVAQKGGNEIVENALENAPEKIKPYIIGVKEKLKKISNNLRTMGYPISLN